MPPCWWSLAGAQASGLLLVWSVCLFTVVAFVCQLFSPFCNSLYDSQTADWVPTVRPVPERDISPAWLSLRACPCRCLPVLLAPLLWPLPVAFSVALSAASPALSLGRGLVCSRCPLGGRSPRCAGPNAAPPNSAHPCPPRHLMHPCPPRHLMGQLIQIFWVCCILLFSVTPLYVSAGLRRRRAAPRPIAPHQHSPASRQHCAGIAPSPASRRC